MAKSWRESLSSAESLRAPLSSGRTARSAPGPTEQRKPGGVWESVRGRLLYPAILAGVSLALRIVSRKKDELR